MRLSVQKRDHGRSIDGQIVHPVVGVLEGLRRNGRNAPGDDDDCGVNVRGAAAAGGESMMAPSAPTRSPLGSRAVAAGGAPLPTRQRRPGYVAMALALIVAFSAVGAWLYVRAGEKTPVVVVTRDVAAGHVIERSDLSTVAVAGAITAVGAKNLESVVGRTAAVPLLPGMLLQRSMVSAEGPLESGTAAVGVALKGGQLPADGVRPGDTVAVLQVLNAGAAGSARSGDAGGAQVLVDQARVYSARPDPAQAGGTLATVIVPSSDYVDVAAAAGAGQVALVEVPPK
jgi:hypothetical protein